MTRKPLISVAIPAYNESANIVELWSRLTAMFEGLQNEYDFEVVVCENGSRDNTFEKLTQIKQIDSRLKIVQLSRNFHMEGGMLAALSEVSGDACVIMSADLQDPPEMIPEMIQNGVRDLTMYTQSSRIGMGKANSVKSLQKFSIG